MLNHQNFTADSGWLATASSPARWGEQLLAELSGSASDTPEYFIYEPQPSSFIASEYSAQSHIYPNYYHLREIGNTDFGYSNITVGGQKGRSRIGRNRAALSGFRPGWGLISPTIASRLLKNLDDAFEQASSGLDEGNLYMATAALSDAKRFAQRLAIRHLPWVGMTGDGIVMLRWQHNDRGLLLLFAGDGLVNFSHKAGATNLYSESDDDFPIDSEYSSIVRVIDDIFN